MKRYCTYVSIITIAIITLLLASWSFAAQGAETSPKEDEIKILRFAIHPYLPAEEVFSRFVPLAEYLTERLGKRVIIEISPDYSKHIEKVGLGQADIAFMGPAAYVRMTEKYHSPKPLLAAIEVDGYSTFRGIIIVRKESKIRTLTDLIGKSFAFGDINSTMSHIVPRYMLFKAGIPMEALSKYKFLSNHDNVALAVLYGDFDAGAVKRDVFEEYEFRGLKALERSPQISEHVFVASHKLPKELVREIRAAFMELNNYDDAGSVLFPVNMRITGLVPASDHDYDNLRVMIQTLEATGAFDK